MRVSVQFVKPSDDTDYISRGINVAGNCVVVAVGGISLGLIASCVLKPLGYTKFVRILATAIPVTIGAFGVVGALVSTAFVAGMITAYVKFKKCNRLDVLNQRQVCDLPFETLF